MAADPSIVGFASELQVNALQARYATPSELLNVACRDREGCAGERGPRLAGYLSHH